MRHTLVMDRGVPFKAAMRKLQHERSPGDLSGFRSSRRPLFGRTLYLLAIQKPKEAGKPHSFAITRPNTGPGFLDFPADELQDKYIEVTPEEVQEACALLLLYYSCFSPA